MEYFSGDDKTLKYNCWQDWRKACFEAEKLLDPKPFKLVRNNIDNIVLDDKS